MIAFIIHRHQRNSLPLLAAVALAAGCNRRESAPAPPPAPAPVAVSSFSREIAPQMQRMCAAVEGCHGEHPTDSVSLDLRADRAYAALVNQPAQVRKGAMRVKPGDPDASVLVAKLTGELGPREGKRMPLDPMTGVPVAHSAMDADYAKYILRPWIVAGAPNN
jgi:hypothetical protein